VINLVLSLAIVFSASLAEPQLPQPLSATDVVLTFPHDGPTRFDNTWGAGRSGGRHHQGTDLMAAKMTPVVAAADGIIDTVRQSPRAGRYIRILHVGGWETWYMHLNNDNPGTDDGRADWSLTVAEGIEPGAFVRAGQLIGYVGDSGNAEHSGSHTHFELHDPNGRINPYPYLMDAFEVFQAQLEERAHSERVEAIEEAPIELK
jgi:murein DD-endopeptidase MepM/ murein hydrolase activator NlpD